MLNDNWRGAMMPRINMTQTPARFEAATR